MFQLQLILLLGGLVTSVLAMSAICPVKKNRPITGC